MQCPQIITAQYNHALAPRDAAIRRIATLGADEEARKQWKIETGYHERSLSETAMFRRKTLFKPKLSSRKFSNQQQESILIINAINKMTAYACDCSTSWLPNSPAVASRTIYA